MDSNYLGHRSSDGRNEQLICHLTQTAELTKHFCSEFNASEDGYMAGLFHDIGKYSEAFQRRLNGSTEKVDHSTAGAFECAQDGHMAVAFAIAGHHGGLPDGGTTVDNENDSTFCARIKRAKNQHIANYSAWKTEVPFPKNSPTEFADLRTAMFYTRMLFSSLVDADFLCTEAFMTGTKRESKTSTVENLNERFKLTTAPWFPGNNELNRMRCKILSECRKGAALSPGLFTLTVPTGGGKTASSMAFALEHAQKYGLKRIIYVIPYTSIIEQNAQVFRDFLGDENVLEHHSNVLYDIHDEATPEKIKIAQATENWDIPIIVTTAVQFFESLFSNRASQCRKLHNLAKSIIIFDEVQMLPIPYLRPCVYSICELVRHYGSSAVLCSATQPALNQIIQSFWADCHPTELCPREIQQNPIFSRVHFEKIGKLSLYALNEKLNDHAAVLCIVNSRKAAQKIFDGLTPEGRFHLSTLMCPVHRQKTLSTIRDRLARNLPCRVVSTSLIEAGVDIDFPVVYREESGLDSILQAAGRCNREGKRRSEDSPVMIFSTDEPSPHLFSIPIAAGRNTIKRFDQLSSSDAIKYYFTDLLSLKGNKAQDEKQIIKIIDNHFLPFKTIDQKFKLIEQDTRTIYIPFDENKDLLMALREGDCHRRLYRELSRFAIEVYENIFKTLINEGSIELLENGSAILANRDLYSTEKGLILSETGSDTFIL